MVEEAGLVAEIARNSLVGLMKKSILHVHGVEAQEK